MSKLTPKTKTDLRARRPRRIRSRVSGTKDKPRLSVFRSNRFLYAQVIDDESGTTLAAASSRDMKGMRMMDAAKLVGEKVAKAASSKGIATVVFDRGGFTYTGIIRALADAARENGLAF